MQETKEVSPLQVIYLNILVGIGFSIGALLLAIGIKLIFGIRVTR